MVKRDEVIKYLRENAEELEDEFVIRPKEKWVTKTFQLKEEVLTEFNELVKGLDMNIRDAATAALSLFISRYKKK